MGVLALIALGLLGASQPHGVDGLALVVRGRGAHRDQRVLACCERDGAVVADRGDLGVACGDREPLQHRIADRGHVHRGRRRPRRRGGVIPALAGLEAQTLDPAQGQARRSGSGPADDREGVLRGGRVVRRGHRHRDGGVGARSTQIDLMTRRVRISVVGRDVHIARMSVRSSIHSHLRCARRSRRSMRARRGIEHRVQNRSLHIQRGQRRVGVRAVARVARFELDQTHLDAGAVLPVRARRVPHPKTEPRAHLVPCGVHRPSREQTPARDLKNEPRTQIDPLAQPQHHRIRQTRSRPRSHRAVHLSQREQLAGHPHHPTIPEHRHETARPRRPTGNRRRRITHKPRAAAHPRTPHKRTRQHDTRI